jgi:hypothetical protein
MYIHIQEYLPTKKLFSLCIRRDWIRQYNKMVWTKGQVLGGQFVDGADAKDAGALPAIGWCGLCRWVLSGKIDM